MLIAVGGRRRPLSAIFTHALVRFGDAIEHRDEELVRILLLVTCQMLSVAPSAVEAPKSPRGGERRMS